MVLIELYKSVAVMFSERKEKQIFAIINPSLLSERKNIRVFVKINPQLS